MKIEKTKLAWKVTLAFETSDERGTILQTYNRREWQRVILANEEEAFPIRWAQENIIIENYGALRGLHGHSKSWLLMAVLQGRVIIGLLDPKTNDTETFDMAVLEGEGDTYQILVPPGIANGHAVLSKTAVFYYLWSVDYRDEQQKTYRWDKYGIDWGIKKPILSERDR